MIEVEKPSIKKEDRDEAFVSLVSEEGSFPGLVSECQNPAYKPWSKIKFSSKVKPEILWAGASLLRQIKSEPLTIRSEGGPAFSFWELPRYRKFFHEFDTIAGGRAFSLDSMHQKIFIQNGILEEAIQSSKIEGAVTTIKEAKRLIRQNLQPKNKSERMILNNYETIQKIQNEWKDQDLSLDLLFEIHFSITKNTDLEEDEQYRLRKNSDKVNVWDEKLQEVAHYCPDENFVSREIQRLINFANDENSDDSRFLHPLVKAIMLHFWIGYLHPFVDGNGRTARALFYWYLLRKGYWAIPFLPISKKIISSPKQYRDAFLLTEQVDYDFNYFFDYNIKQLSLSLEDFMEELEKTNKQKENDSVLLELGFNSRQRELLKYFWLHPKSSTTFGIHQNFHKIHLLTARKDLIALQEGGFIEKKKIGKRVYFFSTNKIDNLFV